MLFRSLFYPLVRSFKVFRFLLILLIILPIGFLNTQKLPKNPQNPKEPVVAEDDNRDSRGDRTQSTSPSTGKDANVDGKSSMTVQASLCDGRQVTGRWEGKSDKIQFHHIREGIRYQKSLDVKDISKLRIASWVGEVQKQESNGTAYRMVPQTVIIQTKSGEIYEKDGGMEGTEFSVLKLENSNGTATIYSMWIDLLYKDGTWYSKLKSTAPKEPRTDCHKDVIREISLLP